MPHYDYLCGQCGKTFEVFQSITEKPLENCLECGGPAKRLIGGGAGIIFKGSGFYKTDSPKKAGASPVCEAKSGSGPKCANCPAAAAKDGE